MRVDVHRHVRALYQYSVLDPPSGISTRDAAVACCVVRQRQRASQAQPHTVCTHPAHTPRAVVTRNRAHAIAGGGWAAGAAWGGMCAVGYTRGTRGLRGACRLRTIQSCSPCAVRRKKNRNQDEVSSSAARISACISACISAKSRPVPPAHAAMPMGASQQDNRCDGPVL